MYALLKTQPITFTFEDSTTSTRTESVPISPPQGTVISATSIALQGYDFSYSNGKQYGFGELGASLGIASESDTSWHAVCVATCRDDRRNERKWNAKIIGVIQYFGEIQQ